VTCRRAPDGFTLIEVMGVILITTIVMGVAVSFYIDLSNQATRATENTRQVRRATALLDRVADDVEHALLVRKPAETDPLAHPWLFVGESHYGLGGSDQLMFVRREPPRSSVGPASDLGLVAYSLERSEDEDAFTLRRWSRPDLPEGLERELPAPDDPSSLLLTDGIESLSFRFLDEAGSWLEEWDSTQLIESSELPFVVEIEVAFHDANGDAHDADGYPVLSPRYRRLVQLPLRPIDLETLLDPSQEDGAGGGEDGDDEYGDLTLGDCIDFSQISASDATAAGFSPSDIDTLEALAQNPDALFAPYADILGSHPAVRAQCR
jgi:type II secretory pathway component PulJ